MGYLVVGSKVSPALLWSRAGVGLSTKIDPTLVRLPETPENRPQPKPCQEGFQNTVSVIRNTVSYRIVSRPDREAIPILASSRGSAMPGKPTYHVPVDAKTIGKRLAFLRKMRGATQVEIADQLGMTQALVSDYERGKLRLHGALVVAFAKALRVSADEILGLKNTNGFGPFKDRRFLKRLEKIDKLPRRDRQVLLRTIDTFLKASGSH